MSPRADMPYLIENERDAVLPRTLWEQLRRWLFRLSIAAFLASLLFHAGGALIMRLIRIGGSGGPPGISTEAGPIEMAIISDAQLKAIEDAALQTPMPTTPEEPAPRVELPALSESGPGEPTPVTLSDSMEVGPIEGGGNISATEGGATGGAGGGGTSFFGVEAGGTRFAFVVDTSASMEGQRFARLKSELRRSLDRMPESNEFIIVAFDADARVLGGRKEWREASPAGRRRIYPHIDTLQMGPATQPLEALRIVLAEMRPRPDAVYFMTDGEFDESVVQEVAVMNSKLRQPVPIHCICFGSQSGETLMKQIAGQSKGTYTFVPGP